MLRGRRREFSTGAIRGSIANLEAPQQSEGCRSFTSVLCDEITEDPGAGADLKQDAHTWADTYGYLGSAHILTVNLISGRP